MTETPQTGSTDHHDALARLVQGVYILGTQVGDMTHGMTVSWVMPVSADPPVVCAALAKGSKGNQYVRRTGTFALSLLGEGEEETARRFAGLAPAEGEPPAVSFETRTCGGPILEGCRAFVQCVLLDVIEGPGDHDLFLAQVTNSGLAEDLEDRPPLRAGASDLPIWGEA